MEPHEPDNIHETARTLNQSLVNELKSKGYLQTPRVEAAFETILRHRFLPETPLEEVYSDRAIAAKQDPDGQWLSSSSQPAIMATMLEQLGLEPGHKVLEIGTGTGYNAALMAHIVGETGRVVTVDIDEDLTNAAGEHLALAGFEPVEVVCADGGYGYADAAPFDRIILTVGAPDIAPAWWDQLKPDGRLVLPLLLKGAMKSIAFERANHHLESNSVKDCGFLPLRGDFAASRSDRVPLGSDQDLFLDAVDDLPIDGDMVYGLLNGDSKDWPTSVEATFWDVMNGTLWTWLALREPAMCKLVAEGEAVDSNIVPALVLLHDKRKLAATAVLLDKEGMAALMRPPDRILPPADRAKVFAPDSPYVQPFELFVRQFGSDESIAGRLITQIQMWENAGRPSSDGMRIRAYPKAFDYRPSEGEFVLEKQWTKIVLTWPASA
jgi:protein-L-isoaspartate(D-aspartate) O-methyltransferase